MIKKYMVYVVFFFVSFSSSARATEGAQAEHLMNSDVASKLESIANQYAPNRSQIKSVVRTRIANRTTEVAKASLAQVGHQGQALTLMLVVSGVELLREQIEIARLKKENLNSSELMDLSGKAADRILLGGETWSSITGAATLGAITHQPLQIMQALIDNKVSQPLLRGLLQSGIASFVTFVGWDAGAQLWTEARELIADDEEYDRANLLGAVMLGSTFSNNQVDQKVLKDMFGNMATILISDDDLRRTWLYNTFRLRLATGGFATTVTSMVVASTVGTMIFPGAGTAAGLFFGVAGGTAAAFMPDVVNDAISDKAADVRVGYEWIELNRLDHYLIDFHSEVATRKLEIANPDELMLKRTKLVYSRMRMRRDLLLTAMFEKVYRSYSHIQSVAGLRDLAIKSQNVGAQRMLDKSLSVYRIQIEKQLSDVRSFYERQIQDSQRRVTQETYGASRLEAQDEAKHLNSILKNLTTLQAALVSADGAIDHAAALLITKIYLGGFSELELIKE